MKILQVMAGAEHGGAETAFVDMCLAMKEAGADIEVATRPNALRVPKLRAAGIPVHELRFGGAVDFLTPFRMKRVIKAFKPDIVQTWMSRAGQKTPGWLPGSSIPRYLVVSRLGGYYKRTHFNSANYFTTITPDIRRFLIEHGVKEDHVRHINNFAETEDVIVPVKRSDFDTPEDAPLLLALGRLHPSKAFDTLMKALVDIPAAYLWIAGEGPQRAELESLRAELGLKERVRFLGWRDDRAALFAAADICVFPSRYEPFGTVFVQAWAQKTPLVTTAASGPRQFVRNGEDGLMVPIDDVSALSNALRRVIEDKDLARRLVENGWQRYQSEFTKEKTVQAYLYFYNEILEKEGLGEESNIKNG